ncbi:hypothetical protein ACE1CD_23365 [Aerosakkonema sp. BLCC-F183]|uniref:hypothetical protein n=1 Tax=Aerosakkonema sp. BLCC-F183 TaxID=3342834 RepID=UPI0035B990A5
MEEWQKNLVEILETVADEVEQFLLEMTETLETFAEFSEEFAHQLHSTISEDIERFFSEIVDPMLGVTPQLEDTLFDEEWTVTDAEDPLIAQYPACVGCRNFHGQFYGGNLLVCGMHPYGWSGENCPDWEAGENSDNDYNPPFIF